MFLRTDCLIQTNEDQEGEDILYSTCTFRTRLPPKYWASHGLMKLFWTTLAAIRLGMGWFAEPYRILVLHHRNGIALLLCSFQIMTWNHVQLSQVPFEHIPMVVEKCASQTAEVTFGSPSSKVAGGIVQPGWVKKRDMFFLYRSRNPVGLFKLRRAWKSNIDIYTQLVCVKTQSLWLWRIRCNAYLF